MIMTVNSISTRVLWRVIAATLVFASVLCVGSVIAGASPGRPPVRGFELPGLRGLTSGVAQFAYSSGTYSTSCVNFDDCVAVGRFTASDGSNQAFLSSKVNGVWQDAITVPGMNELAAVDAVATSVACPSVGNCAVVGYFQDGFGSMGVFAVSQSGGVWGDAEKIENATGTGQHGGAGIACSSAEDCVVLGQVLNVPGYGPTRSVFASQTDGVWGDFEPIIGPSEPLSGAGFGSAVSGVTCPSDGNCVVAGMSGTGSGTQEGFLMVEVDGVWNPPTRVPGLLGLGTDSGASSVSCSGIGNCAVVGNVRNASSGNAWHSYISTQIDGVWQDAQLIPDLRLATSVSCFRRGSCEIAGSDGRVASQVDGTLYSGVSLPDVSSPNPAAIGLGAISCTTTGTCAVVGHDYLDSVHPARAFVSLKIDGVWQSAQSVTGLNTKAEENPKTLTSVSCSASGCVVGGTLPKMILWPSEHRRIERDVALLAEVRFVEAPVIASVEQSAARTVSVRWAPQPASNPLGTLIGYRAKIFVSAGSGLVKWCSVGPDSSSCSIGRLSKGISYDVTVRAIWNPAQSRGFLFRSQTSERVSITLQ